MKSVFSYKFKQWLLLWFIAAMAFFPTNIKAQGRVITWANRFAHPDMGPGDYLKIEELKAFEGTWQWATAAGDSVFTLKLWREKFVPPGDLKNYIYSYDAILGIYSLNVHGRIVSTNDNRMRTETGFPTFGLINILGNELFALDGPFTDFVKNKTAIGRFELFRDNPNKARWSMRNMETIVVPTGTIFHRGFSLPNNVVLHRVQATPPEPVLPPGWEVQ